VVLRVLRFDQPFFTLSGESGISHPKTIERFVDDPSLRSMDRLPRAYRSGDPSLWSWNPILTVNDFMTGDSDAVYCPTFLVTPTTRDRHVLVRLKFTNLPAAGARICRHNVGAERGLLSSRAVRANHTPLPTLKNGACCPRKTREVT